MYFHNLYVFIYIYLYLYCLSVEYCIYILYMDEKRIKLKKTDKTFFISAKYEYIFDDDIQI